MTPQDLHNAGMNQKQAVAFLSILELGEATMSELVKKSRLKRTTLYDLVDSLKEQGLISITKRKKRILYIAENPNKLIEQADEKRKRLEAILPELLSITNTISKKPKVRYFEGIEGIKEVYRDVLRYPDQKMCAWVSDSMITNFDEKFITEYYIPERLKKKIWAEVIASDSTAGQQFKTQPLPATSR